LYQRLAREASRGPRWARPVTRRTGRETKVGLGVRPAMRMAKPHLAAMRQFFDRPVLRKRGRSQPGRVGPRPNHQLREGKTRAIPPEHARTMLRSIYT